MGTCRICGRKSPLISEWLGVCLECLRKGSPEALREALEAHGRSRAEMGLCPHPPSRGRITCNLCSASCRLYGDSTTSYCGLRRLERGRLVSLSTPTRGLLSYYLDPHVTNCCNSWFCPGGTGLGYPRYAVRRGPEYGFYNLAIFLYGCSFDCLFCQNWEHKLLGQARTVQVSELVEVTLRNKAITCWCWFGGSPEPQLPFVLHASRRILEEKPSSRALRIRYEWNGDGHPELVRRAAELAYESGGTVKFDLKAWTPEVHVALTGRDNKRVLDNFAMIAEEFHKRGRFPPVLGASTLLVPGYVDEEEVESIAKFIASLSDDIPYTLLVFHPDFRMRDLPVTPEKQVWRCYEAARRHLRLLTRKEISVSWGT